MDSYQMLCRKIDRLMEEHAEFVWKNTLTEKEFNSRNNDLLTRYVLLNELRERYEEDQSIDILYEILLIP